MSIYSDKLTHVQVVISCPYSVAQICTHEDALAHNFGAPCIDDIMSYNSLTTSIAPQVIVWFLGLVEVLGWKSKMCPGFGKENTIYVK